MRQLLFLGLFMLFLSPSVAFADAGNAGDIAQVPFGSRGAALGRSLGAVVEDSTAVFWNPAGISAQNSTIDVALSAHQWLDWQYYGVTYGTRWRGLGVAVGYQLAKIDGAMENQIQNGNAVDTGAQFGDYQHVLALGVSYAFDATTRVGLAWKEIFHSVQSYRGEGSGLDVGVQTEIEDGIKVGMTIQNLIKPTLVWTTPSKSVEVADTIFRPTISIPFYDRVIWLHTQCEFSRNSREVQGGIEYFMSKYMVARAGYADRKIGIGTGLSIDNWHVDFSYQTSTLDSLLNEYRLSVAMKW